MADIVEIKRQLADRVGAVASHLLPAGRKEGHEWRIGSVDGEAGRSLGVHLSGAKAGVWCDFNSGEGGDLLDLWMKVRVVTLTEALAEASAWLGLEAPKIHRPAQRVYKRPPMPKCTAPIDKALAYLVEDRNIPAATVEAFKVGERDDSIVFPFYLPGGELALVKTRKAQDGASPTPTAKDCEPVLFGWQAMPSNAREVVITEGEIDALSWHAYGFSAMSVPFGGGGGAKQQWIENDYDRLARFEKIYIATDMDGPGEEAAREIAGRLGLHRCLRVAMPHKDGNACLVEGVPREAMAQCLRDARHFDVPSLRKPSDFAASVVNLFWPTEGVRVGYRTPYAALGDDLLFRPAEVTIWTGEAGHGKSQILSDCAVDWVRQGSRLALSSLEMVPAQSLKRMCKQVVGTDRPTQEAIAAALTWLDRGLIVYELTGKQKVDALLEVFNYARARYGCDQFIIDSLMRLGIAGDDYNGQEAVIFRIVDWAVSNAVHVHLVAHSRKGERERRAPGIEDIKGAMELGGNAFNVLSVWRDRQREDVVNKATTEQERRELYAEKPGVLLNVAKQRNGDFEGKVGLWFDQATYRYRSAKDPETWRRQYLPPNWSEKAA